MSFAKHHRKIRLKLGKTFPLQDPVMPGSSGFALAIGDALRREFGASTGAVKMVVALTGANTRAVRNWFAAKNGPSGENLIDLMKHSDEVLETVLLMADRKELTKIKLVGDVEKHLMQTLERMDRIQGR
jgi:hypothetical protein